MSLTARLLVATPVLHDPNFARSVLLVLAHDSGGALGVVLNRPSGTDVSDPLPEWGHLAAEPAVVFVGGPVGEGAAIGLARLETGAVTEGWAPVTDRLGTVDLGREPHQVGTRIDTVRVFAGYAGWGPGQLEAEIDAGSWVVADADPDDALSPDPARLWRRVLRRQGGEVAWLANVPPDLKQN